MFDPELYREITIRVCGTLDLGLALQRAFPLLARLVPLDEIRVNVLDTEMHSVKTIAIADPSGSRNLIDAPLVLPVPPDVEAELAGRTLDDVRIVDRTVDDRATAAVRTEYFPDVPESSLLIMRLLLDGKRQGVLLLRVEGEARYSEEHRQTIGSLNEPFAIAVNNAVTHFELDQARRALAEENRFLAEELRGGREIVGAEFGLARVMRLVGQVAPLDSPVMLLGETGVGKELIADAIHRQSQRREGPFITVNCGAIPDQLVDSELFGHEKGAFTGAVARHKGRFERASGGTLFLDEIGDLPLEAQVRLLRVLQTGQFERVGGSQTIQADVRIVAATHRDMLKLVDEGRFREDLWYRVGVFPVSVPPLRERAADIPALVHHFVRRKSVDMGISPPPALAPDALQRLRSHGWPGNVRELENAVERELITHRGETLQFAEYGAATDEHASRSDAPPAEPPSTLDAAIARHIREALAYTSGRVGGPEGAAELLQVNPSTLRHRMRKLGIRFGRQ